MQLATTQRVALPINLVESYKAVAKRMEIVTTISNVLTTVDSTSMELNVAKLPGESQVRYIKYIFAP